MIEPISALAAAAVYAVARWSQTSSERRLLLVRAQLVYATASLPPGTRINTVAPDGSQWAVEVPVAPAIIPVNADDAR